VLFLTWNLSNVWFHSNMNVVVELISWRMDECYTVGCFFPSWDFTGNLWPNCLDFLMKYWYRILSSCYSLPSNACSLCSASRWEDPSSLRSIFVGCLTTYLPLTCKVLCGMKCCSQTCCSVLMMDGSTGSNSWSGINWAPDCCLLGAEMYAEGHAV